MNRGSRVALLLILMRRIGHMSVVWYLLLSSSIGSFTVVSSKPVATFALRSIEGAFAGSLTTQIRLEVATEAACASNPGFGDGTECLFAGDCPGYVGRYVEIGDTFDSITGFVDGRREGEGHACSSLRARTNALGKR